MEWKKQAKREGERERETETEICIRGSVHACAHEPKHPPSHSHTHNHTQIHTRSCTCIYKIPIYPDHRHFQRRHRDKDTRMLQTFKIIGRPALELDGATMSYLLDV